MSRRIHPFLPDFSPSISQLPVARRAMQVRLSEVLSERISRNPTEEAAASMAEDILRQTQLTNPQEGLALAPTGWHPVKASFEVDKVTRKVCTEYARFPGVSANFLHLYAKQTPYTRMSINGE